MSSLLRPDRSYNNTAARSGWSREPRIRVRLTTLRSLANNHADAEKRSESVPGGNPVVRVLEVLEAAARSRLICVLADRGRYYVSVLGLATGREDSSTAGSGAAFP